MTEPTSQPIERRAAQPKEADQWHLDKKVPLSLIFAMLVQAGMVIWAIADIKKDVEILKVQSTSQRDRDAMQDKTTSEALQLLHVQLDKIDAKLDRIIEKRGN